MKLYFVRHGQTDYNVNNIIQGRNEGTLNQNGQLQVRKLSETLLNYSIEKIISSDVKRCVTTTELINDYLNVTVQYSDLIREKDNGRLVGKHTKNVDWSKLKGTFESKRSPGGENLLEVRDRGRSFIKGLTTEPVNSLLIVSHAGFLKILIGDLMGMSIKNSIMKLFLDNASLSLVEFDKSFYFGYVVKFINNTSHLYN